MVTTKHFYTTTDYLSNEINSLTQYALQLKNKKNKGIQHTAKNKTLATLFFNPSLRTRTSFACAMQKLGGFIVDVPVEKNSIYGLEFREKAVMNGSVGEHIKEAAGVLSRYVDVIAIRASDLMTSELQNMNTTSWEETKKDTIIQGFMQHATVPVINMESNVYHPCQGLADAMTMQEKLGNPKGKKYVLTWTYHPKALPMATPHSQVLAACQLGMDVVVAHPQGWEFDAEIVGSMQATAQAAAGSFTTVHSMQEAFEGADIICAKSWGALHYYGAWEREKKLRKKHADWVVDGQKMKATNHAYFMHCLPVRRNVVVTDEVLDSPNSIILDQAENRMWVQMAVLSKLLGETYEETKT